MMRVPLNMTVSFGLGWFGPSSAVIAIPGHGKTTPLGIEQRQQTW